MSKLTKLQVLLEMEALGRDDGVVGVLKQMAKETPMTTRVHQARNGSLVGQLMSLRLHFWARFSYQILSRSSLVELTSTLSYKL
jgi:hypothetical protein